MKKLLMGLAASAVVLVALPVFAGGGNGAPSGAHYNLNIVGVENPKKSTMNGADGRTIFVALGVKKPGDPVLSNIWLTQGPFQVCDANGFDYAYDCEGTQIGHTTSSTGAVFQLPCNTLVETDYECESGTVQEDYTVWVRALGQQGGEATMTLCAYDRDGTLVCNTGTNIVSLNRGGGKQSFTNVTTKLTSLQNVCFDPIGGGAQLCGDVSLFNEYLEDYVWQYQNNGLRLAQLRFYVQ